MKRCDKQNSVKYSRCKVGDTLAMNPGVGGRSIFSALGTKGCQSEKINFIGSIGQNDVFLILMKNPAEGSLKIITAETGLIGWIRYYDAKDYKYVGSAHTKNNEA